MGLDHLIPRRGAALLAILAALALPTSAAAQLGSWQEKLAPGGAGGPVEMRMTAASGVVSTFSNPSVYVGPYSASLTSDPTRSTFTIYCADFLNSINVGTVWTANLSRLVTEDLGNTRLGLAGASNALVRYQKAAWLAGQFALNQTRTAWTGIHDAIWAITTPGTGVLRTSAGLTWFNRVNTAFASGAPAGFDWTSWRVVTDVNTTGATGGIQEQLVHVSYVTPEPGSYLLLATGLLALFLAYRRREDLA